MTKKGPGMRGLVLFSKLFEIGEDGFGGLDAAVGAAGLVRVGRADAVVAVIAAEEAAGAGPDGVDVATEIAFGFLGGLGTELDHVLHLLNGEVRVTVAAGGYGEALHGKVYGAEVCPFVVPVADEDVLGNHVYGTPGIVVGGFPLPQPSGAAVKEAVSPNHELTALGGQVVMDCGDLTGKELAAVLSVAARALVHAYIKHLVHSGVEGIGLEGVADFVHHVKNYPVHVRVQGAVALAVEAVGIGPLGIILRFDGGSFVILRIFPEESVSLLGPGLVAKEVHLRHQTDAVLLAGGNELVYIVLSERVLVAEFRMGLVCKVPVYPEDEEVHLCRRQVLVYETQKLVHATVRGRFDGEASDWEFVVNISGGCHKTY